MILIGLNLVYLSLDNTIYETDLILERINIVFTIIYALELAINLSAFGFKDYF